MQLKSITAITVLLLVVASLLVAGCTSSSNTASKATATPIPLAADNLAGAINDLYKKENYTVNTPFTMTQQGDTITYRGVITTAPVPAHNLSSKVGTRTDVIPVKASPSETFNVTIVLTASGSTADAVYYNTASTLKGKYSPSNFNYTRLGYEVGGDHPYTFEAAFNGVYRVNKFDPTQHGAAVAGVSITSFEYLTNADMSDYYEILSVEGPPGTV